MKRVRTFLIMNCILSTVFAGTVLAAATPSNSVIDTKKLDQIVESAMAEFQVPGLAIAVVSQD
ncbi:MAG: hypothetical protein KKA56_05230, partial [Gammaproteobacteria bacterium]|nr:hypothetical protein [Gammaproteobacteria bacterium]